MLTRSTAPVQTKPRVTTRLSAWLQVNELKPVVASQRYKKRMALKKKCKNLDLKCASRQSEWIPGSSEANTGSYMRT